MQSVKIGVNEKIFIKDPQSSDLGKRIVEQSIFMIDEAELKYHQMENKFFATKARLFQALAVNPENL